MAPILVVAAGLPESRDGCDSFRASSSGPTPSVVWGGATSAAERLRRPGGRPSGFSPDGRVYHAPYLSRCGRARAPSAWFGCSLCDSTLWARCRCCRGGSPSYDRRSLSLVLDYSHCHSWRTPGFGYCTARLKWRRSLRAHRVVTGLHAVWVVGAVRRLLRDRAQPDGLRRARESHPGCCRLRTWLGLDHVVSGSPVTQPSVAGRPSCALRASRAQRSALAAVCGCSRRHRRAGDRASCARVAVGVGDAGAVGGDVATPCGPRTHPRWPSRMAFAYAAERARRSRRRVCRAQIRRAVGLPSSAPGRGGRTPSICVTFCRLRVVGNGGAGPGASNRGRSWVKAHASARYFRT